MLRIETKVVIKIVFIYITKIDHDRETFLMPQYARYYTKIVLFKKNCNLH